VGLIAPHGLTNPVKVLGRKAPQAITDLTLTGNITVRGAHNGNIVLIADNGVAGLPDGLPDLVIRFAPKKQKAKYQNISFELQSARLFLSDRRVAVISSDGYTWVSVALEPIKRYDPSFGLYADRNNDLPQTVRISRGYALQRQTVHLHDDGSLSTIDLEQPIVQRRGSSGPQFIDWLEDVPGHGLPCSSGGRGSTGCSYGCGGQSCSVTCGSGAYSRCGCRNESPDCSCRIS
jgi:hypothetical protein